MYVRYSISCKFLGRLLSAVSTDVASSTDMPGNGQEALTSEHHDNEAVSRAEAAKSNKAESEARGRVPISQEPAAGPADGMKDLTCDLVVLEFVLFRWWLHVFFH